MIYISSYYSALSCNNLFLYTLINLTNRDTVIFFMRISMLHSLIFSLNFFHYMNYNYWFSGIYDIQFMIHISMEKLCHVICFPAYISNMHGIIAVNPSYPHNTPSMVLRTVCGLLIIWVLEDGSNIKFAIGVHVIIIGIIINNILRIVTHYKLLYFYLIKELFLRIL